MARGAGREDHDRALFDAIAHSYAEKDVIASTRLARSAILWRAVRPVLEERGTLGALVDVGCGVGAQALHLRGAFESYTGIDYSSQLIEIGRAWLRDTPQATLIAENIKSAVLPAAVADTVLIVGALHHMTDLEEVMQALWRLAKPGARLVAIEPQRGNPVIQALRWARSRLDRRYSAEQHFFSLAEMAGILRAAGLSDIRVESQGFLTPPFAQVILRPQWLFTPASRAAIRLEPTVERLAPSRASWNLVAYGRFGESPSSATQLHL